MSNIERLQSYRMALETLGHCDIGPMARITHDISKLLDVHHQRILEDFLFSEGAYENDTTRRKLLSIIDECLAADTN